MAEPGQVAMSSPLYMPDLGLAPTAKLAVPCGPRQRARERSLDNVKEPLPRRFVGCARIVRHRNSAPGHVPEPEFGTCHHILHSPAVKDPCCLSRNGLPQFACPSSLKLVMRLGRDGHGHLCPSCVNAFEPAATSHAGTTSTHADRGSSQVHVATEM